MSWQLGSGVLLVLALGAGFAWYERTGADARVVALVATLAAFAALGRIAFAALPNVKPTTDIVLISGYALGGAPGFAVGALAGLTSNFFFGQGPWTPWQMAAWGATGVLGASLATLTRKRIGRWPLALICLPVGFAFTATQDFGDWVNYSDHSATQLGVYLGRGVGFDVVHAAGCFAFALAFGPALIRSIQRFAGRMQARWVRPASGLGVTAGSAPALALAVAIGALALSGAPAARAAGTPAGYLLRAQNQDGGFGPEPAQASSPLYSGWAALGLEADGYAPQRVSQGGISLLAYLRASAGSLSDAGSLERAVLIAGAARVSATNFGGRDLVAALQGEVRGDGSVNDQVNLTSFGVLALRAAGVTSPGRTLAWLAAQQDSDGGFNYATVGGTSDVDDTGAALEALARGAPGGWGARDRGRAVGFIAAQQNPDGGLPSQPGGDSNAQSTAWAVQGLLSAGVDPDALHRHGAPSPLQYLRSLVAPDGHVRYSAGVDQTPVWVTAQAAMALAREALPLAPVALAGTAPGGGGPVAHAAGSGARRRAGAKHGPRSPAARSGTATSAQLLALATDAGLATAVVLAPVGLG